MPSPAADPREPDPRPSVAQRTDGWQVAGSSCTVCGYPSAERTPRCTSCGGAVQPAWFGPQATLWSWTVVRVPSLGRQPPYALGYVDLAGGPRILVHLRHAPDPAAVGGPVRLVGATPAGDVLAEVGS